MSHQSISIASLPSFNQLSHQHYHQYLVVFGENLARCDVKNLVDGLSKQFNSLKSLELSQYQPIVELSPALVVAGFDNDVDGKSVASWCNEQFGVEAVMVEDGPTISNKGVLLMDMDSTAIEIECIDEIAKLTGVGEQVAAVTKRAMQGELDFSESLHYRVATLAGTDVAVLQQVIDELPLMPGLELLVKTLKAKGWVVAIASGGFTYFTEHLKQRLGLDATFANQLEIVDDRLTGKVIGDVVDAEVKAQVICQLAEQHDITMSQTVAMGDGANDLLMLNQSSLGVAFHAKPVVRQQAKAAVNQGGLDQLLYLLLPKAL